MISGWLSPRWALCRPDSQGREARRSAGRSGHQVRVCYQPQDCQSTRARSAARPLRTRRRGDRLRGCLAAIAHGRCWHEAADPRFPLSGYNRVISGQYMLNASSSHFDRRHSPFLVLRCTALWHLALSALSPRWAVTISQKIFRSWRQPHGHCEPQRGYAGQERPHCAVRGPPSPSETHRTRVAKT
jgi:hypothetical protein